MKNNNLKEQEKSLYDFIKIKNESIKESDSRNESDMYKHIVCGALGFAYKAGVITSGQYHYYTTYLDNGDNFDKILSDLG